MLQRIAQLDKQSSNPAPGPAPERP
jgi:hypothetical protein